MEQITWEGESFQVRALEYKSWEYEVVWEKKKQT